MRRPLRYTVTIIGTLTLVVALQTNVANAESTTTKSAAPAQIEVHAVTKIPPKTIKVDLKGKTSARGQKITKISCNFTMQGSVTRTGLGPEGGPYTLVRRDTTWSTGINCSGDPIGDLIAESELTHNGITTAYSVAAECGNCLALLSPGGTACVDGVACSGGYQIRSGEVLTLYLGGRWYDWPAACAVDSKGFPEQLICQHVSDVVYVPAVWWT